MGRKATVARASFFVERDVGDFHVHETHVQPGLTFSFFEVIDHALANRFCVIDIAVAAPGDEECRGERQETSHDPIIAVATKPPVALSVPLRLKTHEDCAHQHRCDGGELRLDHRQGGDRRKHHRYGEAFLGPGLTTSSASSPSILVGEDPTSIDRILRRMRACTLYASPGLVLHAIHGIETALLDAIGKRLQDADLADPRRQVSRHGSHLCRLPRGDALESISPLLVPRDRHGCARRTRRTAEQSQPETPRMGRRRGRASDADRTASAREQMVERGFRI